MVTTKLDELLTKFETTTEVNRIKDLEFPDSIDFGNGEVKIPEVLHRKDVHFIINEHGELLRSAWINKGLACVINALIQEKAGRKAAGLNQLEIAQTAVYDILNSIVKRNVLIDRSGPGATSFAQANENIPTDSIAISSRTYQKLVNHNKGWIKTSKVLCIRFPNLGLKTTQNLKLLVLSNSNKIKNLSPTSLGIRLPQLAMLLEELEEEELPEGNICDSFYLHPETLKSMGGDGDGDSLYIKKLEHGKPTFSRLNLTRKRGNQFKDYSDLLLNKSDRCERSELSKYLLNYLDNTSLISMVTYTIRWNLFNELSKFKDSPHPMHSAWENIGEESDELAEFFMDFRKGESTYEEKVMKLGYLYQKMGEIAQAKDEGSWFANTVTTSAIKFPESFFNQFNNLQEYVEYITNVESETKLTLANLSEEITNATVCSSDKLNF